MDPIQSHSSSDQQQQQQDNHQLPTRPTLLLAQTPPPPHPLLLPTKYAVKTGTLSTHWLYQWTSLSVLDFHNPDCHDEEKDSGSLVTFIDRTSILHDAPKIQKLSIKLLYEDRYESNLDIWLRMAMRKQVEELELDFDSVTDVAYVLPQFLLESESLVRLKLKGCQIVPQGRINWKNLVSLSLSNSPLIDNTIREILLGCPSLKFLMLEMRDCHFDSLDINSPSVRDLTICGFANADDDSTLHISIPYVQSLSIYGVMKKFHIVNAPSLIDANLDYLLCNGGYEECLVLKEILGKLNHVRDLTLGICGVEVLSILEEKEKVLASLQSKRKCLTLNTELDKRVIPVVAGLLESSPDLKTLIIDMNWPRGELLSEAILDSCTFDWKNYWTPHKMHFKCSLMHVKTIKIIHFRAGEHAMELVQYLLKNARVLKKMVISLPKLGPGWESSQESLDIAMKLLSFPRCFSDAVILFY